MSAKGRTVLINCVAVASGKGGVLKTTIATHLAGLAAAAGWRVLLVDADPQGNAAFDLGYLSDGGAALTGALERSNRLTPIAHVRPGLDVIAGGPSLDRVAGGRLTDLAALDDALRPLADRYDLIVIDAPARELTLRRMILTASRYVIVPSGIDRASRLGLPDAAATINEVRAATNPELDVIAVVGGPLPVSGSRMRERVVHRLGELIGDHDLVCRTVVRHAPLVAEQCRERGILTHEYASDALLPATSTAVPADRSLLSTAATALATDWMALCDDLLGRFVAANERTLLGSGHSGGTA